MSKHAYVRFYDEAMGPGLSAEERYDLLYRLDTKETLKVIQQSMAGHGWFLPDSYMIDPETRQVYRMSLWNCLPDPERELVDSVSDESYVPEKDRVLSYAEPVPDDIWKRIVPLPGMILTVFKAWLEKGRK